MLLRLTCRNVVLFSSIAMLGLMFESVCYGQAAPVVLNAQAMISGPPARGNTPILVSCVAVPPQGLILRSRATEMLQVMPGMWAPKPNGNVLVAGMKLAPLGGGNVAFNTWTTNGAAIATGSGTWQIEITDQFNVVYWKGPLLTP
jgi:hypothetical protein